MKTTPLKPDNSDTTVNSAITTVLVDFWAEWCGPCKMLAPVLDQIAAEQTGKALVAKDNLDESPELASRFNITSIPTLLYFIGVASKRSILTKLAGLKTHSSTTQIAYGRPLS